MHDRALPQRRRGGLVEGRGANCRAYDGDVGLADDGKRLELMRRRATSSSITSSIAFSPVGATFPDIESASRNLMILKSAARHSASNAKLSTNQRSDWLT